MAAERNGARSHPSARRKRRTPAEIRDRLIRAAHEEFRSKGYPGATTAAIAKRADVAEIQMFRYFPSKADLFQEAIFAPLKDHFRAFNGQHGSDALSPAGIWEHARRYTAELQAFLTDQAPALISLLIAQSHSMPTIAGAGGVERDLQAFFNEAARTMSDRAGTAGAPDPGMLVRIAFGTLLGCITYRDWLFPRGAAPDAEIDLAIREFVLAAIGPYSDLGPAGLGRS